jgi:hypothetical protein
MIHCTANSINHKVTGQMAKHIGINDLGSFKEFRKILYQ